MNFVPLEVTQILIPYHQ